MSEIDLFSQAKAGNEVAVSESVSQALAVFNYNGKILDYGLLNGEPIFNLNAIGELLNIANPRTTIDTSDSDYVIKVDNSIVGFAYNRKLHNTGELFLTESGLYMLLMRSNNPNAKPFQKWVTKEVLPSIRKIGAYSLQPQLPQNYLEALKALTAEVEQRIALEQKIQADKPLVDFANQISNTTNAISIRDFAKILCDENITIGEKRLFAWLRSNKYLQSNNMPYQRHIDSGLFKVKEGVYKTPYGDKNYAQTLLTGKGQIYFCEKLRKEVE